jgi:outer membrane receptor protein involved in Fe transport
VVDDFRFGRTEVVSVIGAIDVVFTATERLAFYADYAHEYRKEQMANSAKDDTAKATAFFGFGDDYSPVNFWNSDIREKVDTFGLGATAQWIPARLILDVSYSLSFSTMNIQTNNPNGVSATTLDNAVAQDWGKIRNRLHEVTVDLGYQFTENFKAGFRYLYEWYDLDDFAWNDMEAYMAGQSVENTTKFVFTDATYDGYEAHLGGVYLVCKF